MMEDPTKRPIGDDDYYGANAKLSYYKDVLNNALKGKNPKGFDQFMMAVGDARRKDPTKAREVIESYDFKDALNPQELKEILGDDYGDYIQTVKTIRDRGYADSRAKKLYGETEMDQDVESLMYGKRFATMPTVTSISRTSVGEKGPSTVSDMFTYDPKMKKVNKISVRK
jgi:hypothetical protein